MVIEHIQLNNRAANLSDCGDHKNAVTSLNKALLSLNRSTYNTNIPTQPIKNAKPSEYPNGESSVNEKNKRPTQFDQGYDEGMQTYPHMIDLKETANGLPIERQDAEAVIFYNLGIVYTRLKDDNEAFNYFSRTQLLKQQCEDSVGMDIFSSSKAISPEVESDPRMVAVLHNIGHVHFRAGRYSEAEKMYKSALNRVRRSSHESSDFDIAASLNCIGVLTLYVPEESRNFSGTREVLSEALEIYKSIGDGLGQATVNNNIGRIRIAVGDLNEALAHLSDALEVRKQLLGETNLNVAATIFNIGETFHLQEKIDEALEKYLQFLSLASSHFGNYHPDIIYAQKIIAECYHDTCRHDYALEFYTKALIAARQVYSPIHAETAVILNKIGNVCYEMGRLKEARRSYEDGLEIERFLCHKNDPHILVTLLNIARVLHKEKQYQRALDVYEEGLSIQHKCGEAERMNITNTMSSIGLVHDQMGSFDKAIEIFEDVLDIRHKSLASDHFDLSITLNSLGLVFFHKGCNEKALEMFKRSLDIRQKSVSSTSRDIASVVYNIATVNLEMGCVEEALKYYNDCLEIERSRKSKSGVVSSLKRIGKIHKEQNELNLALQKYEEALQTCFDDSLANTNHVEIAHILGLIGNIHLENSDIQLAAKTFARAIRANRIAGLEDHDNLHIDKDVLVSLTKHCC